jgi:hypothetical protein
MAGLVLLSLLTLGSTSGGLELRIMLATTGRPVLVLPLEPGERFTIHYYHSVENAPIWETHSVGPDGTIFIEEERYLKFGAGMGRMPGVGKMVTRGPYEVIADMHMPTGNFTLRVGSPGVDHTIIWRDTQTNLSAVVPHQAVQFEAHPVSLLKKTWRNLLPHPATPHIPTRSH